MRPRLVLLGPVIVGTTTPAVARDVRVAEAAKWSWRRRTGALRAARDLAVVRLCGLTRFYSTKGFEHGMLLGVLAPMPLSLKTYTEQKYMKEAS